MSAMRHLMTSSRSRIGYALVLCLGLAACDSSTHSDSESPDTDVKNNPSTSSGGKGGSKASNGGKGGDKSPAGGTSGGDKGGDKGGSAGKGDDQKDDGKDKGGSGGSEEKGGSGGAGGAGGSNSAGKGGAGGSGGEKAPASNVPYDMAKCDACEGTMRPDAPAQCSDLKVLCYMQDGSATAGPKAGTHKSNLCKAVVDCFRKSGCSANKDGALNISDCYCGRDKNCFQDTTLTPMGMCKADIEAAVESTDRVEVANRFQNMDYASGNADLLIEGCDSLYCAKQCGFCSSDANGSACTMSGSMGSSGSGGSAAGSGGMSAGAGGGGKGGGGTGGS